MKKIGIMTFHTALNYGAVLQTYALQNYLINEGYENEIIDYRCPYTQKCYSPFFVADGKIINSIVRGFFFGKTIRKKRKRFDEFIQNNLIQSKTYLSVDEIGIDREQYSLFITGSDQVWSPISAGFDIAYFLPFANPNQKYSYAASIGTNILSEGQKEEYLHRLNDFQVLSVREESAADLLEPLFSGRDIFVHVDPTLLLDRTNWLKLTKKQSLINNPYLLIFNVEKPLHDIEFAKKIAKEKNMQVVYLNDRTIKKDKEIQYIEAPAPDDFLSLFAHASIVVTNSFHGTVFSVIFKKEFFVEIDNKKQRNIRVESLLSKLQIHNREIFNGKNEGNSEIDWELTEKILMEEREKTSNYFQLISEMK